MTAINTPANVKSCFIIGRARATGLKICANPCTIDKKSFRAIHTIKNPSTILTKERVAPSESVSINFMTSNPAPKSSARLIIVCTAKEDTCRIFIKIVRMSRIIGMNENIKPNEHAEAQASRLFFT